MSDVTIRCRDNGPFLIEGSVSLVDADGKVFEAKNPTIALCRCGASAKRPFCDGAHKTCEFKSAERA